MTTSDPLTRGPARFARFAYPPNALGYCGPDDSRALLELGAHPDSRKADSRNDGGDEAEVRALAGRFDGAWPYLRLIAAANGIADPLDARVVEAYWIGNGLLEQVDPCLFDAGDGARPHHQYHVFVTYPWAALLHGDHGPTALQVLDRCRVRWGKVVAAAPGEAIVRSRPLAWDGKELKLGAGRDEPATTAVDGLGFVTELTPGDWVALHWDWVCEKLSHAGLSSLRRLTAIHLDLVNGRMRANTVRSRGQSDEI